MNKPFLDPGHHSEMLVLFETPAGLSLFKVQDEGKLKNPDDLWKEFVDADKARKLYVAFGEDCPPV